MRFRGESVLAKATDRGDVWLAISGKETRGYDGLTTMAREHDETVSVFLDEQEVRDLIEELEASLEKL